MDRTVLFLAPQPFFRLRGACIAHEECLLELVRLGWRVDLLSFPLGERRPIPSVRHFLLPRAPWVRDVRPGASTAKLALDGLMFLWTAARLLRRRYAVVHASEESAIMAALLKPLFRYRLIYDMDDVLSERLAFGGWSRFPGALRVARALESFAIGRADAVITNSADTFRAARRHARAGARVLRYEHVPALRLAPLGEDRRAELRRERGWASSAVALYAGSLEPYQGVDGLLRAAAESPRLSCAIVGDGPRRRELERLACELGIAGRVFWLGARPLEETYALMQAADLLVSPVTEPKAIPMKLYLYMAAGRPIVATPLSNHTQLLDDESAFFGGPDPQGLADALQAAMSDPDAAARKAARARERFERLRARRRIGSAAALEEAYDFVESGRGRSQA